MQAKKRLELCREALVSIRRQQADIELLRALEPQGEEEALAIRAQLQRSQELLMTQRRQYPDRLSLAMCTIDGLTGMERNVLWSYYVLGLSNTETAERLHYDVREVVRKKKTALARLDDVKGATGCDG